MGLNIMNAFYSHFCLGVKTLKRSDSSGYFDPSTLLYYVDQLNCHVCNSTSPEKTASHTHTDTVSANCNTCSRRRPNVLGVIIEGTLEMLMHPDTVQEQLRETVIKSLSLYNSRSLIRFKYRCSGNTLRTAPASAQKHNYKHIKYVLMSLQVRLKTFFVW